MHGDNLQKTIWFLWYQGEEEMPEVVQMCLRTWRQHNPNWTLVLLTNHNLKDYMDGSAMLGEQWAGIPWAAKSDLIRVHLLAKNGGVWVDASTYCNQPLDDWLPDQMKSGFFAFARPNVDRMISSWFMAAEKNNPLIKLYEKSAFEFWRTINPKTLLKREKRYRGLHGLAQLIYRKNPKWAVKSWFVKTTRISHYFWFHYLFEVLYYADQTFAAMWDATPEISANGPHKILHHGYLEPVDAALRSELKNPSVPLYKLNWRVNPSEQHGTAIQFLSKK